MDEFIAQIVNWFKPLDLISILVTFFITQRVKKVVHKKMRPVTAIVVGLAISAAWAVKGGGWDQVPAYGFVYGAGAIALYMIGFGELIKKIPWMKKFMGPE